MNVCLTGKLIFFLRLCFVQLWLCLAALCVIDKEHAEALSSGQWLGQDGKPKSKVTVPSIPVCVGVDEVLCVATV